MGEPITIIYAGRKVLDSGNLAYGWVPADQPEVAPSWFAKGKTRVIGGIYQSTGVIEDGGVVASMTPSDVTWIGRAGDVPPEILAGWEGRDNDADQRDRRRKAEAREKRTGLVKSTAEDVAHALGLRYMTYRDREMVLGMLRRECHDIAEKTR